MFNYNDHWKKPVIKIGKITLILATITSFIPAIYLTLIEGANPAFSSIIKSWFTVLSIYGMMYIIEPISFYSVLGLSGTYLSFLSGNIGNMRVPCSIMAMEVTNSEPGTSKAEIVSIIAIVSSVITNIFLLTLMAFAGASLLELLPPQIIVGFQRFTIPSVYGAMFLQIAIKNVKLIPFSILIPYILIVLGLPAYIITFFTVLSMIIISRIFYLKSKSSINI
ncbi:hypothetical protein [uncultured Cetobacterium sp.]|uniref:hypothetical protein n=1 Tax=uncultured Cetobacterium sp. TaxID=527638 RepID=UPI0026049CA0|nr:hypothetical protein [uncultured Cetobacterium sp.]